MGRQKYPPPKFLTEPNFKQAYLRWLHRKAVAHVKRDRHRGHAGAQVEIYKLAIHEAVVNGGDRDAYTGKPLNWNLISKYDNAAANRGGRQYKKSFGDLPTLDHEGDDIENPVFRNCSWRTNDSKNDLSYEEFVALCKDVLKHFQRKSGHAAARLRAPKGRKKVARGVSPG